MAVDPVGIKRGKQRDDHGGVYSEWEHSVADRDDSGDGAGDDWKSEGRDRNSGGSCGCTAYSVGDAG